MSGKLNRVRTSVYLPTELKERAVKLAEELGVTFSSLCNIALSEYIKQSSVVDLVELVKRLEVKPKSD